MVSHSSKKIGALPYQTIIKMINAGFIKGAELKNVRPASLDLSVSSEIYEMDGIFQPRMGESIRDVLNHFNKKKHPLSKPLEVEHTYIVRLNEHMKLPETVYAFCNPKSTSGRLDVHVRIMADGVPRYDALYPAGWSGELWMLVVPRSFSVKLKEGQTLSQVRFFNADMRLDSMGIEFAMAEHQLIWGQSSQKALSYSDIQIRDNDGSLILTLDLENEIVGYEAIATKETIDLAKIEGHDPKKYFKPIKKEGGLIRLKKNSFYILSTLEAVRVPPDLACEMVPMDERSGEFRSHYAGFIDPGWGWGKKGEGKGRPLTLEVRPFEDIIIRNNQPIGKIRFEYMAEIPKVSYDELDSNYRVQNGPKLSKHFKKWK